jgi:hypothetical protein
MEIEGSKESGTEVLRGRPRGRSRGRIAGLEVRFCRLPHPFGWSQLRRAEQLEGFPPGDLVEKRMLSQAECERPVTGNREQLSVVSDQ